MNIHTLYIRRVKDSEGKTIDTFSKWGFIVKNIDWPITLETKEIAVTDFPDSHGEYSYVPKNLKFKAYDLEVTLGYKGVADSAYLKYKELVQWMTGVDIQDATGSAGCMIYSPYYGIGRKDVYLKSVGDAKIVKSQNEEMLTIKITLRVCDPMTDVKIKTVSSKDVIYV